MAYTDPGLVKYYNQLKGTSKTSLTLADVISIGTFCKCVAITPADSSTAPIYLTDGFMSVNIDGINYVPTNDFIVDSWGSVVEENDVNNDAITLGLSAVQQNWIDLITGEYLRNAVIQMYLAVISPASGEALDTQLFFTGYLDYFEIDTDGIDSSNSNVIDNKITVHINSIYKKLDLPARNLCATAVHQFYYPGDHVFDLVGKTNTQTWSYDN